MNASLATIIVFGAELALGVVAYRMTATMGDRLPPAVRQALRVVFGFMTFFAVWCCSVYGLWAAGFSLDVPPVTEGRMHDGWWLGPVFLMCAVLGYAQLRQSTTQD